MQKKGIILILLLTFVFAGSVSAQTLEATHAANPKAYIVGSNLTVTTQISYDGSITALGVEIDLPDGWSYVERGGGDSEPDAVQIDGETGDLGFVWIEFPASPVNFTYTVKVPETAIGSQEISAIVKYRRQDAETQEIVTPNPLDIDPLPDDAYEFRATHSSGRYVPDSNLTVNNRIDYTGFLSALGVQIDLPDGWSYVSHPENDNIKVKELASGSFELIWVESPATPISFTYTVYVPEWVTGQQEISSRILYRRGGEELIESPAPLYVQRASSNGYVEGTVSPNVHTLITTTNGGETWTVSDGSFSMIHMAGQFVLTAQAEGYETYTTPITVSDMETTQVDIVLTEEVANTTPVAEIVSPSSDVTIREGESVDFYASVTDGNAPFTYSWNFYGGFKNSNEKDPGSITFHKADTYNVTFLVRDDDGEISTDAVTVTVIKAEDDTEPVVSIVSPPTAMTVSEGESVNFEGEVTYGNAPFEYSWDFGGGAVNADVEDPGNVTFQDEGVYVVTFTVTDNDDDQNSDSVTVTVEEATKDTVPTASIISPSPPITIFEGESLDFEATVTSGNPPFIYSWNFDNAAASSNVEDPGHVTFHTAGVYDITFTVTEADKPQDTDTASVTVSVKEDFVPSIPVASIESPLSDKIINEGGSVNFQGSVTEGNAPFIYSWDFEGAAPASNLEDPGSVTFHKEGVYTVSFTVTEVDTPEDIDTASVTITVKHVIENTQPEAAIVSPLSDMTIFEGESVAFDGNVTDGNAPFSYSWDFGGGAENSALEDPGSVIFSDEGTYKIIFTVTDKDNDVDSDSVTITVKKDVIDTNPNASIVSPPSNMTIKAGESVDFQGSVLNGNPPFSYVWDFGSASEPYTGEDPGSVTFAVPGKYTVTFQVTDSDGDFDMKSVVVTVEETIPDEEPIAAIASPLSDMTIQEGRSLDFQGSVTSGNAPFAYAWNFSGGAEGVDVEDPGIVTFDTYGTYTVTFTVTDSDGDESIASRIITVIPPQVTGYMMTNDLRIGAVINTLEKGPIEAIWREGGQESTAAGDYVIWGYFYASPVDVNWGSYQNPELFVKIWFDRHGRIDVNYFHVSVPDIDVYSDYPYDGAWDSQATTTLETRYIRQYYQGGQSYVDMNIEDGLPAEGYDSAENPWTRSNPIINKLNIASVIKTVEKGPIDAVWRLGGVSATARGDQVVWGLFHADPDEVAWGSEENPDLFVKVWFDITGRVDVNFFHVSVPDIEVYSDFPANGVYNHKGTTIMDDRYIRHEYLKE